MAAPTVAAIATFPRGPGQTPDNLTGLPNLNVRGLGSMGVANTKFFDDQVGVIQIRTGTVPGSPNGTGAVGIWIASSEDGIRWTDGLDPDSVNGAAQVALFASGQSITNRLVQRILTPASATIYTFDCFSVFQTLGYMPSFWGIFVSNNTGGAFDSTAANFRAQHSLVSYA